MSQKQSVNFFFTSIFFLFVSSYIKIHYYKPTSHPASPLASHHIFLQALLSKHGTTNYGQLDLEAWRIPILLDGFIYFDPWTPPPPQILPPTFLVLPVCSHGG